MKEFKIEVVLSAIQGVLLCKIGEVYEVLNFLTGDNLYTHQLPRAGQVCRVKVFQQHPFLKTIDLEGVTTQNWKQVIDKIKELHPHTISLTPIDNWHHIDPVEEAAEMMGGTDKIITVNP